MNKGRVTLEELDRVWAGESVILPLDARNMLRVQRVGYHIRLTPTGKMVTIKAPGAPGEGEAP